MANPAASAHPDDLRRAHNYKVGLALIEAGIPIFHSFNKNPTLKRWNKLDTELSYEDREAARQEQQSEGKLPTNLYGSTVTSRTWERMLRVYGRDGTASVCCGLARIVVIDADIEDGKRGVEKFEAFMSEHGGLPEGTIALTSRSGGKHYVFADREGRFRNTEGGLTKLDCNVRGKNGQIVAPGSWRIDGAKYGTLEDLQRFINALKAGTLPKLPQCLVDLIGEPSGEPISDSDPRVKAGIAELQGEWPDFGDVFGEGKRLDAERLKAGSEKFEALMDDPRLDRSANRLSLASVLKGASSRATVRDFAVFCGEYPDIFGEYVDKAKGPGTYDDRNLSKDFATATPAHVQTSTGEAMGNVAAEDEADEKAARTLALIEHLEGAIAEADVKDNKLLVGALEAELKRVRKEADRERSDAESEYISLSGVLAEPETYTRWAVKHFVPLNSTIIAAGLWGSGKTAVYLDIALHVAHGLSWRDRKVKKGVVVYVALENPRDVQSRIRAWFKGADIQPEDSFVLYRGNCSLFDPRDKGTKSEKKIIELANKTAEKLNLPVALVIIDTLSQAILPGSDREHGSLFVNAMLRIASATGACVTALHHPTKAGNDVRGDGAFQGNTDGIVLIARDRKTGRGTIKASPQKFRLGDPRKVNFGYRLDSVTVGKDEDGEDITIALAVEAPPETWAVDDSADDDGQQVPPPPDTPNERPAAMLRVIRERIDSLAANTGDTPREVEVPSGEVLRLWNVDRKRSGLPEITDLPVCSRLLARLVEAGELVRVGESKRSTAYKLAPDKVQ